MSSFLDEWAWRSLNEEDEMEMVVLESRERQNQASAAAWQVQATENCVPLILNSLLGAAFRAREGCLG